MPAGWIDGWWNLEANRLVLRRSSRVTRPPRALIMCHILYEMYQMCDVLQPQIVWSCVIFFARWTRCDTCYNLCNLDKVSTNVKLFVGGPWSCVKFCTRWTKCVTGWSYVIILTIWTRCQLNAVTGFFLILPFLRGLHHIKISKMLFHEFCFLGKPGILNLHEKWKTRHSTLHVVLSELRYCHMNDLRFFCIFHLNPGLWGGWPVDQKVFA